MATTTAKITVTSSDLMGSQALNLASTATLTDENNSTGTTQTSGLASKVFGDTNPVTLFDGDAYGTGSHKLYIKNLETDVTKYFEIKINAEVIGRLYAVTGLLYLGELLLILTILL